MIILDLMNNLALLLALSVLSGFIGKRCRHSVVESVLQGVLFGCAAMMGMTQSVLVAPGIFFDGRTVVLSLCGLFFGPLAAVIASFLAVACRLGFGGAGQVMGVLTIFMSTAIGVAFYRRNRAEVSIGMLWGLGLLVYGATAFAVLSLPKENVAEVVKLVALPIFLINPLATVFIGRLLSNQNALERSLETLQNSREEFRTTLYSIKDGIITTDMNGCVCQLNPEAERLLGWTESEIRGKRYDEFFKVVDEKTHANVESPVERVLSEKQVAGLSNHAILVGREGRECPIADSSAPIYDKHGKVIGAVLVFRDQSEQQKAIQIERDNLRAVINASPVAIVILDRDTRILSANPAAEILFGRSHLTMIRQACGNFLGCVNGLKNPDGCGCSKACATCRLRLIIEEVFASNQGVSDVDVEYTLEVRGKTEDYWLRVCMEPVLLEGGRYVMVALMNMTNQKCAEKALRESEQRYRILANSGRGLIWMAGVDKRCDYFNEPWLAFTGRTFEQEQGNGWVEGVHPDRRSVLPIIGEAFDRHERFDTVYRLRRHDGVYRWVQNSGSPRYDTQGVFLGYLGHCLDITESRLAEENLRRIEWMLSKKPKPEAKNQSCDLFGREALVAMNHDGLIMKSVGRERLESIVDEYLDLLGTCSVILEANGDYAFGLFESGWCRLLDRSTRENCGTDDNAVAVASGRWLCHESCWTKCAKNVIATRAVVDSECHGGLHIYAVPIMVRDEVVGVIAFGYGDPPRDPVRLKALAETCRVDIETLRRESESYDFRPAYIIEMAKDRLRVSAWLISSLVDAFQSVEACTKLVGQVWQAQKMDAIGRLAGGVAHDFNNVLQAVIGYGEMLLEKVPEGGEAHQFANEIVAQGKRAGALTRQLLTLARKQAADPKILDLNEAVTAVLKILRRTLGENISLVWTPVNEPCFVKFDVAQIEQILVNLTINARDAISDVGKVMIGTEKVVFSEISPSLTPGYVPGPYVVLTVADTGCGMDQATQDRLFEPFFTTKARGKGTGLGLATIYGIVTQNHGFISVHSELGEGSSFKICLPEYTVPADAAGDVSQAANGTCVSSGGHETVLLVDDEESLLRVGRHMLEGLGYKVLTAMGPEEALRIIKTYPSDIQVLLTDVVMPGMSGGDLRRKAAPMRPKMRCIYMSGFPSSIISQRNILGDGDHFLQKPFSRVTLSNKLKEVLSANAAELS